MHVHHRPRPPAGRTRLPGRRCRRAALEGRKDFFRLALEVLPSDRHAPRPVAGARCRWPGRGCGLRRGLVPPTTARLAHPPQVGVVVRGPRPHPAPGTGGPDRLLPRPSHCHDCHNRWLPLGELGPAGGHWWTALLSALRGPSREGAGRAIAGAVSGGPPRRGVVTSCGRDTRVAGMAIPSDELFPSIHFLTELGALLGRHGYTPADVPVAHAVGQAIPELVAFLSAYMEAFPARASQSYQ